MSHDLNGDRFKTVLPEMEVPFWTCPHFFKTFSTTDPSKWCKLTKE